MGLSMYACAVKKYETHPEDNHAVVFEDEDAVKEWNWRKEFPLHGFFFNIYEGDDEFNCVDILVKAENLLHLKEICLHRRLESTEELLFDIDTPVTDTQYLDYLIFVEEALLQIEQGNYIIYSCWW